MPEPAISYYIFKSCYGFSVLSCLGQEGNRIFLPPLCTFS